jgi:hypothetical protein
VRAKATVDPPMSDELRSVEECAGVARSTVAVAKPSSWVPEGSLVGFVWVGFWGLGGFWGV